MDRGTLGEHLRTLRKQRKLTQAQLAERAQVSTRSIVYWESDQYTPGEYEMQAVLNALGLPVSEQAKLLLSLSTRRSENLLRVGESLQAAAPEMILPGAGDLLSTLRARKGWTRARAASMLGVTVSTLGRWETNRYAIPDTILPQIEVQMQASPAEIQALQRRMALSPDDAPFTLEQARQWHTLFYQQRHTPGPQAIDLIALTLQRKLWLLTVTQPEARLSLAQITHAYANWLYAQSRFSEGQTQAVSILHLYTHDCNRVSEAAVPGTLNLLSWHAAYGEWGTTQEINRPEIGLRLLNRWLPRLGRAQARIPLLADAGLLAAGMAQFDLARRYLADAERASMGEVRQSEPQWYLQYTRAKILLAAGRPLEALEALPFPIPEPGNIYPDVAPFRFLLYVKMLLAAGERDEAAKWLANVYTSLAHVEVPRLRASADTLARQL